MKLLELFSGIGGFAKGFEQAGFKFDKHYFSEIDKHAIANYKHNFPNAESIGSVTDVSGSEIERPDIITFGFPCQDLSIAGKRKGFDGERSSLFYQAMRIINEVKPDVFIFENVKGLFSSNGGKDFTAVLRTIADIGLYECEWQLVNTKWVLPQNRERVYFIGHLRGRNQPGVFPFREDDFVVKETFGEQGIKKTIFANKIASGLNPSSMIKLNLDTDYIIHNTMPRSSTSGKGGTGHLKRNDGISYKIDTGNTNAIEVIGNLKGENGHNAHDVHSINGIAPAVRENHGKVTAIEVNPSLDKEGNVTAIDSHYWKGHGMRGGKHRALASNIRRLTEIECERLQGFPDNWTQYGNYDGEIKKIAKSQRYKLLGNAVTVNIVKLIAERLIKT